MTLVGAGLLAGRYELQTRLAAGAVGEVWRARDVVDDRAVAVKLLRPERDTPQDRARFADEARHAAGLAHPGIAQVLDSGEQDDGRPWIVLELVEGRTLAEVLAAGPLDVATALDVVGQAALALDAAHRAGVVHRDVKPGNLLVRPDGVVKVTDFGLAHALGRDGRAGAVVGTAYYLAPEQARDGDVTGAADVYALGVVAYECLTGRRPFPGTDPQAVADAHLTALPPPLPRSVPAAVRELVLSALAKDPADRPASAAELGRRALALRAGPAASPRQRHHRGARLAAALLVVLGVGLGARSCLSSSDVVVPTVPAGGDAGTATRALQDAGLGVDQRAQPSASVPAGAVVGTDPAAGSTVGHGRVVTLLVSSGAAGAGAR